MKKCSECGYIYNPDKGECSNCRQVKAESEYTKKCPKCGKEEKDREEVCYSCKVPLVRISEEELQGKLMEKEEKEKEMEKERMLKIKRCPYCAEKIKEDAIKCKHCGEMLDGTPKEEAGAAEKLVVVNGKNPGVAFILSFFLPGFGQFYNGQIGKGFLYLIGFWILIWTIIGGIIVWIAGMADAYDSANKINIEMKGK